MHRHWRLRASLLDWWEGSASKDAWCQAWGIEINPSTHMVEEVTKSQNVLWLTHMCISGSSVGLCLSGPQQFLRCTLYWFPHPTLSHVPDPPWTFLLYTSSCIMSFSRVSFWGSLICGGFSPESRHCLGLLQWCVAERHTDLRGPDLGNDALQRYTLTLEGLEMLTHTCMIFHFFCFLYRFFLCVIGFHSTAPWYHGLHHIFQAGFKFTAITLPQPPDYWNYRHKQYDLLYYFSLYTFWWGLR